MNTSERVMERAAVLCAFASAVSVLLSIAVSQIFLALALAALLMSDIKLRLPSIWLPIATFMGVTVISMLASGAPAEGRPQIRKFYVYLMLLVVYSSFRGVHWSRRLVLAWSIAGGVSAILALVQFVRMLNAANQLGVSFYQYYIAQRITGFMSHWMTFGGLQMIVLVMLVAFLFFSPLARKGWLWPGILCGFLLSTALLLGFTRAVWLGTVVALAYLVWVWRPRVLLALPIVLAFLYVAGPASVRERFDSIGRPKKERDSNEHRIVCWRTGWEMIKAHPLLGLGPEIVNRDFQAYVPEDIARPLPDGWYGHLHNIYIHYAAERGVPAALVLLWMFIQMFWDFRRALLRIPAGLSDRRAILHGAVAVLIAIMISGIFELNLGDSEVLAMFLAVVACGYLAADATLRDKEPVSA